ncbi:RNA polymerase sigma factor (sigma-70 family) [Sporomusaceae bacterium BoRhaA]|uniref:sigma-70 family RNA polymerase sigma factor n=1 Tax=Pelorhabdus rhamnosifermentans TaxID=2772457 RepID=UPI001C0641CC|nr:sigma-70 family RNA polymerase sigma factor [Pelorhabdus rhamnosifermentans]MBU2703371.1 RNA polymerase sigma factor (sigma-70 family) [Pelorhabdus rhamnosifermentans]
MLEILDSAPLVKKYTWNKSDDEKAEAWLAVVEAFATYDSSKGVRLPGYVESRVKYAVWNMLKKKRQYVNRENIESCFEPQPDHIDVAEVVELKLLRERLCKVLSELSIKQRQAIVKTIVLGYSLTEYARELGVIPQAVFNLRKSGLSSLKKMLA